MAQQLEYLLSSEDQSSDLSTDIASQTPLALLHFQLQEIQSTLLTLCTDPMHQHMCTHGITKTKQKKKNLSKVLISFNRAKRDLTAFVWQTPP